MQVEFETYSTQKGLRARKVRPYQSRKSLILYSEMSEWKKEAKSDNLVRYFFQINHLRNIETGNACYVIGRKGSGKTAIGEYIINTKRHDRFSKRLSFKSVPFNKLYKKEDKDFTFPNQYQTMWKYVIFNQIAKMIVENESIPVHKKKNLDKILTKLDDTYNTKKRKLISRTFNIKIFGTGIGIGSSFDPSTEISMSDANELFEEQIFECIDQCQYYLVFDELDEDFKSTLKQSEHHKYAALLTSLFKAVQDVKSTFVSFQIFPIVLLRDDIFRMLEDPDRTKWKDLSVELIWKKKTLKDLLAFRIAKAIDQKKTAIHPKIIFQEVFESELLRQSSEEMSHFDFISSLTMLRPRDYVEFMKTCAVLCIEKKEDVITDEILLEAEGSYSQYLQSELEDEAHGILPEIKSLFEILALMGKKVFKYKEFSRIYRMKYPKTTSEAIDDHLQKMFEFGIIGVKSDDQKFFFKHLNPTALYNAKRGFKIHQGLFKSLNIV